MTPGPYHVPPPQQQMPMLPQPVYAPPTQTDSKAVIALILGILSILCCGFGMLFGIPAIVLGAMSKRLRRWPDGCGLDPGDRRVAHQCHTGAAQRGLLAWHQRHGDRRHGDGRTRDAD